MYIFNQFNLADHHAHKAKQHSNYREYSQI